MNYAILRLALSGIIAFFFYAAWAYYANSLVIDDTQVLYKAALVQGAYSGGITLVFTFVLELFYKLFSNKHYCLAFIVPAFPKLSFFKPAWFSREASAADIDCATTSTFETTLKEIEKTCSGACVPGMILTPIPAIAIQSLFVIGVNTAFMTPNLWLTVAPSIIFSSIYGYAYSISLTKKLKLAQA